MVTVSVLRSVSELSFISYELEVTRVDRFVRRHRIFILFCIRLVGRLSICILSFDIFDGIGLVNFLVF